jgi:predicted MFS family arabinose efflux permease
LTGAVARTLPAMTAVQAVVAMGVFALSVLAPQLGVDLRRLGFVGSALFTAGALSSLLSGWLVRRLGDLQLAALCMGCVMLGMLLLAWDASVGGVIHWSLWPAVILLGCAFGPETPASASVLSRVTPPARRPWVFSIRQTGNQIGAIAGSLALPVLMVWRTAGPFAMVAALALCVGVWCMSLVRRDGGTPGETVAGSGQGNGLREVAASPLLRLLTLTMVVFMATQVCLNFFVMSHSVRHWQLSVPVAAGWVALMQAAGLAGRLFWGRVAGSGIATARLLGGLGVWMGAVGLLLFLWPGTPPSAVLAVLIALLGFSASGWNGVMIAEISRAAGSGRAGAVTGAALMFGYAGLAVAPLAFAAMGQAWGTDRAYAVLLCATAALGLRLLLGVKP